MLRLAAAFSNNLSHFLIQQLNSLPTLHSRPRKRSDRSSGTQDGLRLKCCAPGARGRRGAAQRDPAHRGRERGSRAAAGRRGKSTRGTLHLSSCPPGASKTVNAPHFSAKTQRKRSGAEPEGNVAASPRAQLQTASLGRVLCSWSLPPSSPSSAPRTGSRPYLGFGVRSRSCC